MHAPKRQKTKPLLESVTVSDKGQISIPVKVRDLLGIEKGDVLVVIVSDNKMLIEKSETLGKKLNSEFDYMLKLSESSAKELWDNERDNVWDSV
jgi:AbrB family looped-hinge helix DNA binding protein